MYFRNSCPSVSGRNREQGRLEMRVYEHKVWNLNKSLNIQRIQKTENNKHTPLNTSDDANIDDLVE